MAFLCKHNLLLLRHTTKDDHTFVLFIYPYPRYTPPLLCDFLYRHRVIDTGTLGALWEKRAAEFCNLVCNERLVLRHFAIFPLGK